MTAEDRFVLQNSFGDIKKKVLADSAQCNGLELERIVKLTSAIETEKLNSNSITKVLSLRHISEFGKNPRNKKYLQCEE